MGRFSVTSYSGSPVGGVTTYDLLNGKLVRKLNAKGNIVDVAYSPNGQALAVAVLAQNRSGAVVVYDTKNERVVYSRISDFPVYDVEFISNGHCLLSSGGEGIRMIPMKDLYSNDFVSFK